MGVLINQIEEILSQCTHLSNHHNVDFKFLSMSIYLNKAEILKTRLAQAGLLILPPPAKDQKNCDLPRMILRDRKRICMKAVNKNKIISCLLLTKLRPFTKPVTQRSCLRFHLLKYSSALFHIVRSKHLRSAVQSVLVEFQCSALKLQAFLTTGKRHLSKMKRKCFLFFYSYSKAHTILHYELSSYQVGN